MLAPYKMAKSQSKDRSIQKLVKLVWKENRQNNRKIDTVVLTGIGIGNIMQILQSMYILFLTAGMHK